MRPVATSFLAILLFLSACTWTESRTHVETGSQAAASNATVARPPRIDRDRVGVVLIDAQPAFWSIMHGEKEPVMERIEQLLVLATITERPLLATFEHSPERNGWLPQRLEKVFPKHGRRIVKRTFDCCREKAIRKALGELGVDQIVLAGAETDVCVLQSALGLLEMGFQVFLLEDCVFSNEPNPGPALQRMYQAGVVPCTFKTFFYEMDRSVDRNALPEAWRKRLRENRSAFKSPYRLTPRKNK